ncbi:ECF-type sigma factor [Gimesia chilikensis]|uniref:ECF-type sigma factor n=1 Tax=Gimesia chilikensis TaxID=2605989 RepID=UPI003A92E753
MNEVNKILLEIQDDQQHTSEELFPLVFNELHKLASQKLLNEDPGITLQATALVNELYLRLVDVKSQQLWKTKKHFFGAAAEAMRRILIERARKKMRIRHGGEYTRLNLDLLDLAADTDCGEILLLDTALEALESKDPKSANVVKLRFFSGLTIAQTAEILKTSSRQVNQNWEYARAWLFRYIQQEMKR